MEIQGGKSYNKFENTYNILIDISIPKNEMLKIKDDALFYEYIDKKFTTETKKLFVNAIYDIVKGV